MWADHVPEFVTRGYRVVTYSRRNHFPNDVSSGGAQDLAADLHGEDLAALIRAMQLPPVHVVAHSAGAHAALFLAVRHPSLVRSLSVVEPPAGGLLASVANGAVIQKTFAERLAPARQAFLTGDVDAGLRLFADAVGGSGTYDRRSDAERRMMRDNADAHIADSRSTRPRPQFTCEMAKSIIAPALLLRGERSPEFFGVMLNELARCLPQNVMVNIPESAHSVPAENPQAFRAAVLAFIERR